MFALPQWALSWQVGLDWFIRMYDDYAADSSYLRQVIRVVKSQPLLR